MATAATGPTGRVAGPAATVEAPAGVMAGAVIADPAPLGLGAFGLTTLVLSCINAGWIGGKHGDLLVLSLAVPFGGVAQALAGMWAFRRGNTFAATAFTAYGAFWISFYLLVNFFAGQAIAAGDTVGSVDAVVGLYLFAWGVFTAYMLVASLGAARAVQLVFLLLTVTFFFLAFGKWNASDTVTHIGGYVGVGTAVAALYASFADVTNAALKRTILPT